MGTVFVLWCDRFAMLFPRWEERASQVAPKPFVRRTSCGQEEEGRQEEGGREEVSEEVGQEEEEVGRQGAAFLKTLPRATNIARQPFAR
jgi:hypothetical protein